MFTALSLKNKQPNNFIQIKKKIFIVFKKKDNLENKQNDKVTSAGKIFKKNRKETLN